MKKVLWLFLVLAIVIGFFVGKYLYKKENNNENEVVGENIAGTKVNTANIIENVDVPTSTKDEKISVNTKIVQQLYYNKCNHMIETVMKDTTKYINMTEDMLKKEFPNWEIKEFTSEKVVLYREEEDFCNEHFLVKDVDGYVTIYTLNASNEVLEILKTTDIATKYLTDADKSSLKDGITIYTEKNLNKLIEDFE